MQNKNLIPLSDFVLEQEKRQFYGQIESSEILQTICNYAKFLKQPLKLEMFIPCDEKGNVLKTETVYCMATEGSRHFEKHKRYWEAKEKVLFEFNLPIDFSKVNIEKCKTIEEFLNTTNINIFLTPSALNKIGIKE